jgi:hypothetical protein
LEAQDEEKELTLKFLFNRVLIVINDDWHYVLEYIQVLYFKQMWFIIFGFM